MVNYYVKAGSVDVKMLNAMADAGTGLHAGFCRENNGYHDTELYTDGFGIDNGVEVVFTLIMALEWRMTLECRGAAIICCSLDNRQ